MTDKQAVLRDLKVIAILDKKIDYSDHDNIGAVLALNPRSLFSTEYGQRYLDRIHRMYDKKPYDHTCILCGTPLPNENPVCGSCYKMITLGNAVAPELPKQAAEWERSHQADTDQKPQGSGQEAAQRPGPAERKNAAKQGLGRPDPDQDTDKSGPAKETAQKKKPARSSLSPLKLFLFIILVICCIVAVVAGAVFLLKGLPASADSRAFTTEYQRGTT